MKGLAVVPAWWGSGLDLVVALRPCGTGPALQGRNKLLYVGLWVKLVIGKVRVKDGTRGVLEGLRGSFREMVDRPGVG